MPEYHSVHSIEPAKGHGWRRILDLVPRAQTTIGQCLLFRISQYFFLSGISLVWAKGLSNTTYKICISSFVASIKEHNLKVMEAMDFYLTVPCLRVKTSQEALSAFPWTSLTHTSASYFFPECVLWLQGVNYFLDFCKCPHTFLLILILISLQVMFNTVPEWNDQIAWFKFVSGLMAIHDGTMTQASSIYRAPIQPLCNALLSASDFVKNRRTCFESLHLPCEDHIIIL